MKVLLSLVCLTVSAAMARPGPDEKYTTKYDNVDLEEILNNQRLYKTYFDCIVNRGKCIPQAKEIKDSIPDALSNECIKCSEKQKESANKVIKFMVENKPDDFKLVESMFDPEHHYRIKYKDSHLFKLPDLE